MEARRLGAAIGHGDAHQDVVWRGLRIFDLDVEVAAFVEQAGVLDLVLRVLERTAAVLRDESIVGKGRLRILVEHPHVGVRRDRVEVVVELLDILAMIALLVGKTEQALLQDGIAPFHKARDRHQRRSSSANPAMPSSPQR